MPAPKSRSQLSLVACLFIAPLALPNPASTLAAQPLPGSEHYTPTKLEWLAVELNSTLSKRYTQADPYLLNIVPMRNEDTLLIFVRYHPQLDREVLNIVLDSTREVIRINAESRGWDTWLQVRERVERISTSSLQPNSR